MPALALAPVCTSLPGCVMSIEYYETRLPTPFFFFQFMVKYAKQQEFKWSVLVPVFHIFFNQKEKTQKGSAM